MGLYLPKELENGVTIDYWRIYNCNVSFGEELAVISVAGYLDQEARKKGKSFVRMEEITYRGDEFKPFRDVIKSETGDNILAFGYALIKGEKRFDGAKDV